jgi:hypothetical protein
LTGLEVLGSKVLGLTVEITLNPEPQNPEPIN